ncbi:unnamed protein product [Heligmosomoides polygyrus]|uniref:DDE_Tnp_ISL3 domain-containing protein n=1 Tax=Heligmosomoides polygyrus TaxID=6339 RepID=A0A183FSX9_HELPZ|nr:unnamed protein product [Heligmosomoides polygyrus]
MDVGESSSNKVNGTELAGTSALKYQGSAIASDGRLMVDVNTRVSAAWTRWRSLTGVLCDKKMPERLKSKIHQTVVRPIAVHSLKCWPASKKCRFSVMEMKAVRSTAGVTHLNRIRNGAIRQKFGVGPIAGKMREALLRWYGHVLRGKEDSVRKIGLNFEVSGKRTRGRPKPRCGAGFINDLQRFDRHWKLLKKRELTRLVNKRYGEILALSGFSAVISLSNLCKSLMNPAPGLIRYTMTLK